MISDARDYEGTILAHSRNESQSYYYGYLPSMNPDGSPYTDTFIVQDSSKTYEEILGHDEETANRSTMFRPTCAMR